MRYTIRPEVNYTPVSRLRWCVGLSGGGHGGVLFYLLPGDRDGNGDLEGTCYLLGCCLDVVTYLNADADARVCVGL